MKGTWGHQFFDGECICGEIRRTFPSERTKPTASMASIATNTAMNQAQPGGTEVGRAAAAYTLEVRSNMNKDNFMNQEDASAEDSQD